MPTVIRRNTPVATPRAPAAPAPKPPSAARTNSTWAPIGPGRVTGRPPVGVGQTSSALFRAELASTQCRGVADAKSSAAKVNVAAMTTLETVANELATQLTERGQPNEAAEVLRDFAAFKRANANGSTVPALDVSMARNERTFDRLTKLSTRLDAVNRQPSGDAQQAYNSKARADAVVSEAKLAVLLHRAVGSAEAPLWEETKTFYSGLAQRIDAAVDSRGGSMEPMERSGLLKQEFDGLAAKYAKLRLAP